MDFGGKAIFHEYQSYATWRVIPEDPQINGFVTEVMASWGATGGEPDIVPTLIPLILEAGPIPSIENSLCWRATRKR